MTFDDTNPFGTYKPTSLHQCVLKLSHNLPSHFLSRVYISALRRLSGMNRTNIFDVDIFGYHLRLYPRTNICDKKLLLQPHRFDAEELDYLKHFLSSESQPIFIDIGANIGAYSLYVASLDIKAQIFAIEAEPNMFKRLAYHIELNHAPITPIHIAVADQEGLLPFYINEKNKGENSLVHKTDQSIDVTAKPLLTILSEHNIPHITALKIDIEGAEFQVFNAFFANAKPDLWPKLIIVEHLHRADDHDVIALLHKHDYQTRLTTKKNVVLVR